MNEPKSISLRSAFIFGLAVLALGLLGGYGFGVNRTESVAVSAGQPEDVDLAPLWRAWEVIDEKFVPASVASTSVVATTTAVANQERVWGMVAGLAASLDDPYTFFLPPDENRQFAEDMSGRFEGVGMEIAVRDKMLVVVTPIKGTPAQRAGIRSGDRILKIDGKSTEALDADAASKMIRGPRGSQVALTMLRDGWTEPREIKVTREVINVPIIETEVRDDVFIIKLMTFTANSPSLFRDALRAFVESGRAHLVLDLRGNPGGYLDAAVDIASWFLPTGSVVVTEDYAGNASNIVHRSRGYDVFNENLKMVILVDRGSASASEILADALHHYKIARMVGTNTFGKGSVQELVEITPDTALKITVARWLGPGGVQIPLDGLKPDTEVKMSEEDFKAKRDPQLDKAIELVTGL